jgi:hypothetical protein
VIHALVKQGRRYKVALLRGNPPRPVGFVTIPNPLIQSAGKDDISRNIAYLLSHPEELTAKTTEMKRKQAIAIAYSVFRKNLKKLHDRTQNRGR